MVLSSVIVVFAGSLLGLGWIFAGSCSVRLIFIGCLTLHEINYIKSFTSGPINKNVFHISKN
jgi:hypothetical protein